MLLLNFVNCVKITAYLFGLCDIVMYICNVIQFRITLINKIMKTKDAFISAMVFRFYLTVNTILDGAICTGLFFLISTGLLLYMSFIYDSIIIFILMFLLPPILLLFLEQIKKNASSKFYYYN